MSHHLSPRQRVTERPDDDYNPWLHAVPDTAAPEVTTAPLTPVDASVDHGCEAVAARTTELEQLYMSELRVLADQLGLSKGGSKVAVAERIARVEAARGLLAVPARSHERPEGELAPVAAESLVVQRESTRCASSAPTGATAASPEQLLALHVDPGGELLDEEPAPTTGPRAPHRTVPAPPEDLQLPLRRRVVPATVWWVGAHGGAGETTLTALVGGSAEGDHAWPVPTGARGGPAPVVLVARTSTYGLLRAQLALTQWAAGEAGDVTLLGLVLVADAPGRLPKPLHQLADVVAGGAPRTWHLPWVEAWRLGTPASDVHSPRPARRLARDVARLTRP